MGNPFFEGLTFRRDLAAGQKLEQSLAKVFDLGELRFLAQEAGIDVEGIVMTGAVRQVLANVLDAAAREGMLDAFLVRVTARKLHPAVRAAVDAVREAGDAPAQGGAAPAKRLEHAEVLELHQLLIARSFVTPDKIDVLLAGVPAEVVAARPHAGTTPAEKLLSLLTWLNDEGPLLHALRNAQAIAMATATSAQKAQFERLLRRLA